MVKFSYLELSPMGLGLPNLAKYRGQPFTDSWRQYSRHWPFSEPWPLFSYLDQEKMPWRCETIDACTPNSIFPIAVSFMDHSIDWFGMMPDTLIQRLRSKDIRLMFYYSEGDNPVRLRRHLDQLAAQHQIARSQILLVTANSACDLVFNGIYFADDELMYRLQNRDVPAEAYHEGRRSHTFTALVRTHKWWRCAVMTNLWTDGFAKQAFFSYNRDVTVDDLIEDCPIRIDDFLHLRSDMARFMTQDFRADTLSSDQHNQHHLHVSEHYNDSYLNIILETHMDADQSGGVFLTEKTFKPIKHAQPFVIFGAHGSLATLRKLGYRTFDSVIDPSYDLIYDTTLRYHKLLEIISNLMKGDLHQMYLACRDDILHNQQHFLASKAGRLNNLLQRLSCM